MMGPMRIPLELYYLGVNFLIVRAVLSIVMGVVSGLLTLPVSKWIHNDLKKRNALDTTTEVSADTKGSDLSSLTNSTNSN